MNRKVTVIGAGHVGATAARGIADRELADVVLLDILEGIPQGKGLDMFEACPIEGSDSRIFGTNDYADTANADLAVITAGLARKPGMSRDDLLLKNFGILKSVTEQVVRYSPHCVIVVVTNPLDAMCQVVYRISKFPRERVNRHGGCARLGAHAGHSSHRNSMSRSRTRTPSYSAATAIRWCRCPGIPPWQASRLRSCWTRRRSTAS